MLGLAWKPILNWLSGCLVAICCPTSCICSSRLTCSNLRLCRLSSSSLGKIRKWNLALGNLSLITTTEEVDNTTFSGFFISVRRPVVQLGLTFGWGGAVLCLLSDDLSIFSGIFVPFVLVQLPIRKNLYCPSSNSTHCPILSIQDCPLRST